MYPSVAGLYKPDGLDLSGQSWPPSFVRVEQLVGFETAILRK